ncbi:MAG TPA: hypothetical protein VIM03_01090 [Thermoleophilaceae bacterium]
MSPSRLAIAAALAALMLVPGCGGSGQGDPAPKPPPVARPQDFPKPGGKTIAQMRKRYAAGGPVLAPSVSQLQPGTNRFGFGLFDRARAQIADAPVVLYVANTAGGPARGPYPAHFESLHVQPQYLSRSVSSDPTAAKSVYVADLHFPKAGRYETFGLARLDDRLVAATPAGPALNVLAKGGVPDVGQRPPRIHTPTKNSVGGDLAKIDTRDPHSTMHDSDFYDVLGKKPIMLLFATPALCQSRVCGPVVDIAEQVKAQHPDDAKWIDMEIYNDNQVDQGFRPQVSAFNLPTEPWLFAIDRHGRVAARIEGAYSARELEAALQKAVKG